MTSASRAGATLPAVSVVVPALDEEDGIAASVTEVREALERAGAIHEIIVVDDGSSDETAARAAGAGARVISLPENLGYGAALKMGIREAAHDVIAILDGDGTYPGRSLPDLLEHMGRYDMVVGARVGEEVRVPTVRRPAKWFLRRLASYLAGREIPDLNSGMRVMRRDLVHRFAHLLPSGFSFTTSITLAALCNGSLVRWEPISYHERMGRSKIRAVHAFDFTLLVLRMVVYFNPLRVFLPLGAVSFAVGLGKLSYDLSRQNVSDSAVIAFLAAGGVWSLGLISDQIARMSGGSALR